MKPERISGWVEVTSREEQKSSGSCCRLLVRCIDRHRGTSGESFKDRPYQYGEKLYVIRHAIKEGKPVSLAISGSGEFFPLEGD
jgi:hypothetical protein